MADIERIRVGWSQFPGGPGVSTFWSTDAASCLAPLRTFFATFAPFIPSGLEIQVEDVGDIVDTTTGDATGNWSGSAQTVVVGSSSPAYAAPVGLCINWMTNGFLGGRRTRGRTFMVPWATAAFDTDGGVISGHRADVNTTSQVLIDACVDQLGVFSRPPATPGGAFTPITTAVCSLKAAVLRSRRD